MLSMRHLTIGILGIGGVGETHLRNCLLMQNVTIAVADTSKAAMRKAKKLGVKEVFADYRDLLSKGNVDAVVVALPHFLHKDSACMAAERGIDLFVEKPLGRTARECEEIIECAKKHHVKLMVGFNQRFYDHNHKLKSMIEKGLLGEIQIISGVNVSYGPLYSRFPPAPVSEWWLKPETSGGGALIDNGSHMIDLVRWLMSSDLLVDHVLLDYKYQLPVEDTAILTLRFKSARAKAILTLGWFTSSYGEFMVDVFGTVRSISSKALIPPRKVAASEAAKNIVNVLLGRAVATKEEFPPFSPSHYRELKHFIACVREDKEPLVTGEDGLECGKVIDRAYELARLNEEKTQS